MKRNRHQLIFRPFCQGLVLKILNMRPTFAISPLAVIHGGKGAAGLWEVPETTRTILCPGDRLIFVEPHPEEGKKFQKCVNRCSILIAGFGSWRIRLSTIAFFHIYLEPKSNGGTIFWKIWGPIKCCKGQHPKKEINHWVLVLCEPRSLLFFDGVSRMTNKKRRPRTSGLFLVSWIRCFFVTSWTIPIWSPKNPVFEVVDPFYFSMCFFVF